MEWYWWILIIVVVILVVWWVLSRNAKVKEKQSLHEVEHHHDEGENIPPLVEKVQQVDNLEVIEGIGPKIAGVLRDAGITSFKQLANEDPGNLKAILEKAGLRLADPTSWPQQAQFAADGDLEGLKALQDRLIAGRIEK